MTLWGWDASHYDAVPTGRTVVNEGITFMTHKAGGDAHDAELKAWWTAMLPVRGQVMLGAYWVLRPDRWDGAAADARAFLSTLDDDCPGWRNGPFILQLDCEKWNDDPATVPTKAEIQVFCQALRKAAPKLMPIVYAPEWVYADKLSGLGYPTWASSYVTGSGYASKLYPGDTSSRWSAYGNQVPAILQFTSSATIAGQTTCDANAYRGTITDLLTLLAPGWGTGAPTPPKESTPVATEPAATLNDADLHKIFYTDGLIPAPANGASKDTNPDWTLRGALQDTAYNLRVLQEQNSALVQAVETVRQQVVALSVAITPPPSAPAPTPAA
jgi:hypothetical protein